MDEARQMQSLEMDDNVTDPIHRPRVWDLSVRLTHLGYILAIPVLWWTGENRMFAIHIPVAIILCAVLAYRIYWGIFGSTTAKFATFIKSPWTVLRYAQDLFSKNSPTSIDHNPIGGWSVALILSTLVFQIFTGLFTVDTDGLNSGGFARFISFSDGRYASDLHENGFNALVALLILHLSAAVFYRLVKKQNLIGPMITGYSKDIMKPTQNEASLSSSEWVSKFVGFCIALSLAAILTYFQYFA